ncbi:MAG: AAA family ATPase, partial [Propionibacteriaceae bacterium]
QVINRAIWAKLSTPQELLVVPRGHRTWRVLPHHISHAMHGIRERGIHYEAGRQLLPQQLAHQVLLRMEAAGDSPDDRVQNAVARTREVKAACAALWPKVTATQVIFSLLSDPDVLAEHADGILTPAEQTLVLWTRAPRSAASARWSLADVILLDEATDVLTRTPSLGHLIIDEAQDLSPMALRAVGRRASTGSVTLLGDLAQATTPWATTRWADALAYLGKPETVVHELTAGFRVPGEVIDYAVQLLPQIAPGLSTPHSVRRSRGELTIYDVDPCSAVAQYAEELSRREGTVGIIVPEQLLDAAGAALAHAGMSYTVLGSDSDVTAPLELVPATLAKGLEFDHVCLLDPSGIVAAESNQITGLRRLYVCLTRAVSSLIVLNSGPMPGGLVS